MNYLSAKQRVVSRLKACLWRLTVEDVHGDGGGCRVTGLTPVGARVAALRALDEQVGRGPVTLLRDDADPAAGRAERYHLCTDQLNVITCVQTAERYHRCANRLNLSTYLCTLHKRLNIFTCTVHKPQLAQTT